jgi:hypothetical protein
LVFHFDISSTLDGVAHQTVYGWVLFIATAKKDKGHSDFRQGIQMERAKTTVLTAKILLQSDREITEHIKARWNAFQASL